LEVRVLSPASLSLPWPTTPSRAAKPGSAGRLAQETEGTDSCSHHSFEGCLARQECEESRLFVDAAAPPSLTGPLSPELVLVSPPEIARMARILLPSPSAARPVTTGEPTSRIGEPGAVELTAVWLFCLAMTLGPVLFILAANG
jgi:hypothetical protein